MLTAPELLLRLLIVRDCPAVVLPVLILTPLELSDNEICLHLELRDTAIKILIDFFAESHSRLQLRSRIPAAIFTPCSGTGPVCNPILRQSHSHPVESSVCKVGKHPENEARLVIEELASVMHI